jgi:cytoskeletal protein CcmA (bactofilin family)
MALFGKGKDAAQDEAPQGGPDRAAPKPAPDPRPQASGPPPLSRPEESPRRASHGTTPPHEETSMANVGKSITIKGDLTGDEDVLVEGRVEGKIELPQNQLTVGANGVVEAHVEAKTVIIVGRISGDVVANERLEVQGTGVVDGDVKAPRLVVEEGAVLNGSIAMTKKEGVEQPRPKPAAQASAPPPKPAGAGLGSSVPSAPGS